MRIAWIRVRHTATGGETDIPPAAIGGYRARGWVPVDEADERVERDADHKPSPTPRAESPSGHSWSFGLNTKENQ